LKSNRQSEGGAVKISHLLDKALVPVVAWWLSIAGRQLTDFWWCAYVCKQNVNWYPRRGRHMLCRILAFKIMTSAVLEALLNADGCDRCWKRWWKNHRLPQTDY
jgi:hypothetical protein